MVFVADVVGLVPTKAEGDAIAPPAGLPTVTVAADGKPTLKVPDGYKPPATTKIATLIKGGGAVVGPTDTILIQYQGTNLATGKIFDSDLGQHPVLGRRQWLRARGSPMRSSDRRWARRCWP